jgi:hypothetical protein
MYHSLQVAWSESYALTVPVHTRNPALQAVKRLSHSDSAVAEAAKRPSDGRLESFDEASDV